MYLKRFVYDRLLDWKNEGGHSTLEVGGARQVGKTYLIQKFADENYKHKIYINLFELSGNVINRQPTGHLEQNGGSILSTMPSSYMNRTLLILKIPSSLLTKSRSLPKFITVSGSLHVTLKPISSSQEATLDGFMIQNSVIPAAMSPNSPSIRFLLRSF